MSRQFLCDLTMLCGIIYNNNVLMQKLEISFDLKNDVSLLT